MSQQFSQGKSLSNRMRFQRKPVPGLEDVVSIVKLRRKFFYFFASLMVIGSLAKFFLTIPTYTGTANIYVQAPTHNPLVDGGPLDTSEAANIDALKKYMRYLKSTDFFLSLAENLKFRSDYSRMRLVLPQDLSITRPLFWKYFFAQWNLGGAGGATGKNRSGDRMDAIAQIAVPDSVLIPVEKLAYVLQEMTRIESDGTTSISISVTGLDSYTAMIVSNSAVDLFVKLTTERDQSEVSEVRKFIEKQLVTSTEQLKQAELDLVDFKKKNNLISLDNEHRAYVDRLAKLDEQVESAKMQLEQNQRLIEYYDAKVKEQENRVVQNGSVATGTILAEAINSAKKRLDGFRRQKELMVAEGYDVENVKLKEINAAIDDAAAKLRELLARAGTNDVTTPPTVETLDTAAMIEKVDQLKKSNKALETQVESLEAARATLVQSEASLPDQEQKLVNLTRNATLQFDLYSQLSKKLQEVEIQRVSTNTRIVGELGDMPKETPHPGFLVTLIFSILAGLFFGAVMTVLTEYLDSTVREMADLEDAELSPLGQIPHIETSKISEKASIRGFRKDLLVCWQRPDSPESMAFKFIRTQLKNHSIHQNMHPHGETEKPRHSQTFMITSPGRGEGKSLIAANLALCMSMVDSHKRTVILDCDFRNPSLHLYFGYGNREGLTSLLSMKSLLEDIVIRGMIPNLDVIPAGFPMGNPTELLGDEKFSLFLEYLKSEYDYILIDAPGVLTAVDATVLAGLMDVVILVSRYRKTTREALWEAHQRILQVCHRHVHAILDETPSRSSAVRKGATIHSILPHAWSRWTGQGNELESEIDLKEFEKKFLRNK